MRTLPRSTPANDPDPIGAALRGLIRAMVVEVLAEAKTSGPTHYHSANLPDGVTPRAFLDGIRGGTLPASRVGRRWMVTAADFETWMASKGTTPKAKSVVPDVATVLEVNRLQRRRA